jgi:ABC-type antimicrobial peptide transport system permease subunit
MENQQLDGGIKTTDGTSGILAENIVKDMPEIQYATTVTPVSWFPKATLTDKEKNIRAAGQFAGADFFNIFSFKLLQGSKDHVLADNKSIVLSEDMAKKLFNTTENVVGKMISWKWQNINEQFQVSGIYKSNPLSSMQFDYLLPFTWLKVNFPFVAEWGNYGPNTYIIVRKGASASQLNSKITDYMKSRLTEANRTLLLQQYSKAYLHGRFENGAQVGGRIEYVRLFSIVAIFILVIACVNFMNLSTAKASRKLKEVGLKKTFGARRSALIYQYFGESILLAFLSLIVALILVLVFLPSFNELTGKHIGISLDPLLLLSIIGITLLTGIIAGSYPALYLSGFNPASVLKGIFKTSLGELWVRKGLVVFQFTISVVLIVCVLVTYKQIEFIQNQNLGYDKDNIIYFEKEGKVAENTDIFLAGIRNIPGIMNASGIAQNIISSSMSNTMGVEWPGKQPNQKVQFYNMDVYYDLPETMGMQLKEGRSFSRSYGTENSKIIFNETAIKTMGLTDPVGKTVKLWGNDMQIIGVVKDFHFESLHEYVKPLFLRLAPDNIMGIMVKIKGNTQKATLERLEKYYAEYNPGFIFDYKFLDEDYQALYVSEKRVVVLSRYFAILAVVISCLGLFGLAAFTAERKFKEIGIRKTLGSTDFQIVYLLSRGFTIMVGLSILIAIPISFFMARVWLDSFQYRIDLKVWYFLSAAVIALLITWLTVGIQALKAARINTVKCLRTDG